MSFNVDFIGIGSGKCGSTWLYDNLVKHPQIFDQNLKELNYFSDLYDTQSQKWYASQFSGCGNDLVKGEFSVTYLMHSEAAQRIHNDYPNAKLLAIVRDPVKRAFSNYLHSIRKGDVRSDVEFSEYIKDEKRLAPGQYVEYLEKYFNLFDSNQIHVVITEEFAQNSLQGYRELYQFLGIKDVDFVPPDYDKRNNVARSYRYLWLENILTRTYRWLSRKGYTKFVKQVKETKMVAMIRNVNQDKNLVPTIDEASKTKLQNYYRPYNKRLEILLDRDLSVWENSSRGQ